MKRVRILVQNLGRTGWQCWICKVWVDDSLTHCPVNH